MVKKFYMLMLSLIFIFTMAASSYCSTPLEAIDDFDYFQITDEFLGKDFKYYTAIGDSMSTGYGLNTDYNSSGNTKKYRVNSFVNLLGAKLKSKDVANLSSSDTDIEDLLLALRQLSQEKYIDQVLDEYIKQAKVITITLGQDLIIKPIEKANKQEALDYIDEEQIDKLIAEIDKSVEKFIGSSDKKYEDGQFMQIVELIRDMNTYGDVIVQTIYNPYKDTTIGNKLDKLIDEINSMIKQNASKETYKVVDTCSLFENSQENIFLTDLPYPNELGHELIYKQHLNILNINN